MQCVRYSDSECNLKGLFLMIVWVFSVVRYSNGECNFDFLFHMIVVVFSVVRYSNGECNFDFLFYMIVPHSQPFAIRMENAICVLTFFKNNYEILKT